MSDLISFTCRSCRTKTQVPKNLERFACASCGSEHIVTRSGGIVSISLVEGSINEVKPGVDKITAELDLYRLKRDINRLKNNLENLQKGGFGWEVYIFLLITGLLSTIAGITSSISSTMPWMTPIFYIPGILMLIFGSIGIIRARAAAESEKERILEIIRKIETKETELKDKQSLFNNQ